MQSYIISQTRHIQMSIYQPTSKHSTMLKGNHLDIHNKCGWICCKKNNNIFSSAKKQQTHDYFHSPHKLLWPVHYSNVNQNIRKPANLHNRNSKIHIWLKEYCYVKTIFACTVALVKQIDWKHTFKCEYNMLKKKLFQQ